MKKIFKFYLFLSFFIIASIAASADEILATVNGEGISKEDVNDFVVKSIPGATFSSLTDIQKKMVVNQMIDRRLFLEDAKRTEIQNSVEYQKALKKLQENLLLDYWMKMKVEEITILESEAKKYYFENAQKFLKPAAVKVRHILVATQEEALAIIAELELSSRLKEKFIALAHSESIGPSSVNGGELDWFGYEQMVPEFSEAAFSLKVGTFTKKPVKTQFGYHIIYLEDKREEGVVPYESVKSNIVKSLRLIRFKTKLEKLSKKLRKTANIIVK